ncbi:MAG: DASH family cryptochrome [Saprospiraceae bacterium]
MDNKAIVWFRNDLRIHDNEALTEALVKKALVFPVYVFDERIFFGKTSYGFLKTGKFRAKFILESVEDLRNNLRNLGSDLIVRIGKPEEEIFSLAKSLKTSWVYCNRERTSEEVEVQDSLEKKLWTIGQELRYTRGKMLYYTSDLPFPINQAPDTFTIFRKEVERLVPVRLPLPSPKKMQHFGPFPEVGTIPDFSFFNSETFNENHVENINFRGGESKALNQLDYFLQNNTKIVQYNERRQELFGWDFSSKLSPWLSTGCLSPKLVYCRLKEHERTYGESKSSYGLFVELLGRDFFRLIGKKYGSRIFKTSGLQNIKRSKDHDFGNSKCWFDAKTNIDIVDACLIQLKETGYLSFKGRQLVSSYLVNDLQSDWLLGAEFFESLLLDYDPCSNYGNWNQMAGIGHRLKDDRFLNPETQVKKLDPHGFFVKYWLKHRNSDT